MFSTGLNYDPKWHLRFQLYPLDFYVRHTSRILNMAFELDVAVARADALRQDAAAILQLQRALGQRPCRESRRRPARSSRCLISKALGEHDRDKSEDEDAKTAPSHRSACFHVQSRIRRRADSGNGWSPTAARKSVSSRVPMRSGESSPGCASRDPTAKIPTRRSEAALLSACRSCARMKPAAANRWEGEVYNAQNGKMYSANIALVSDDVLKIEGCVLGGLFCGGENWTRVQPVNQPAPLRKSRSGKGSTRLRREAERQDRGWRRTCATTDDLWPCFLPCRRAAGP